MIILVVTEKFSQICFEHRMWRTCVILWLKTVQGAT